MIVLDGKKFLDKKIAFEYLNEKFDFEYFVTNLDGLFDCLSSLSGDVEIINYKEIYTNLNEYGERMINVFLQAALSDYISLNLIDFGDYYD